MDKSAISVISAKSTSYDSKTKDDIEAIIGNYIIKEKAQNNLESQQYDMLVLEKDLQKRYNKDKTNNFPFPEIKNVLDCIADRLKYFQENHYKSDERMYWMID